MTPERPGAPGKRDFQMDAAKLRVELLLALLDEHRALDTPHSNHWYSKESDLIRRLARAQIDLDSLDRRTPAPPPSRT